MAETYIHSTCGQSMVFKAFKPRKEGDTSTVSEPLVGKDGKPIEVVIEGGAYVLNRELGRTKRVCITKVTDEQLAYLHSNDGYLRMKARGFFTEHAVGQIEADSKGDPLDMQKKDNTSQISDADHAKGTDPRLDHAATRATAGIANQEGGMQPLSAQDDGYGPIHL